MVCWLRARSSAHHQERSCPGGRALHGAGRARRLRGRLAALPHHRRLRASGDHADVSALRAALLEREGTGGLGELDPLL